MDGERLRPSQGEQRGAPQRFWKKTEYDSNGCLIWLGAKDKDGYGFFRLNNKNIRAHRYAFLLTGSCLRLGEQVCHKCDNPSCVRPDHLFAGSASINAIDSAQKKRRARQKLSVEDAKSIRERFRFGEPAKDLALEYGVGGRTIYNVVNYVTFAHVS